MDVVLSFFTGYLQKGNLILNHGDIARHYLRLGKECVTWVEAVAHAAGIHFQPWLQIFFFDVVRTGAGRANGQCPMLTLYLHIAQISCCLVNRPTCK